MQPLQAINAPLFGYATMTELLTPWPAKATLLLQCIHVCHALALNGPCYGFHLSLKQAYKPYYEYCKKYPAAEIEVQKVFLEREEQTMVAGVACMTIYRLGGVIHHWDNDHPAVASINKQIFYKYGQIHRDGDKPAMYIGGVAKKYLKNGHLYRDNDKPAVVSDSGLLVWFKYYEDEEQSYIHRDNDKPAVIDMEAKGNANTCTFYKKGKIHRDNDKPAKICVNGDHSFHIADEMHREVALGPALVVDGGSICQNVVFGMDYDEPYFFDPVGQAKNCRKYAAEAAAFREAASK